MVVENQQGGAVVVVIDLVTITEKKNKKLKSMIFLNFLFLQLTQL